METEMIRTMAAETLGLDPGNIHDKTDLVTDLGANAMDLLAVAVKMEETFSVSIDRERLLKARTVSDFSELLD